MASTADIQAQLAEAQARLAAQHEYIASLTEQINSYQARLKLSEAQLRMITDHLPIILSVIEPDGTMRSVIGKAMADIDLVPDLVVGKSVDSFFAFAPNLLSSIHRSLKGEHIEGTETFDDVTVEAIYHPYYDEHNQILGSMVLATNVTDTFRNEQERLYLQEQVILAQQASLRELSTPLIPVANDVVVMPLVGSIDSARAQQVIEGLLQGVSETRAKTAILDITGVPVVDTQVANVLLRAAQAVRLLGATVVLTGIRPEVAQTLVGLGADLSGIVTRGTLQSAIAQALRSGRHTISDVQVA